MCPEGASSHGSLLHAAAGLPWLAPSAASLTLLARSPVSARPSVRHDPAAVLLLLRGADACPAELPFPASLLSRPAPLEHALYRIQQPPCGAVAWQAAGVRAVYEACRN